MRLLPRLLSCLNLDKEMKKLQDDFLSDGITSIH